MSVIGHAPRSHSIRIVLLLVGVLAARSANACSTFLIKDGPTVIVGHNLDQDFYTPGSLLINPRGQTRHSRCATDLGLTNARALPLSWTSRFGSATFTILGQGFPDGGVNEAGLVIAEMALGESRFPRSPNKPVMFIHQWIQYQLDSYASVSEVLSHVDDINIDPRATFSPVSMANYHLFVADANGAAATIEFLDGRVVVHSEQSLPVPVLCNIPYAVEMKRYAASAGLLGPLYRWFDSGSDQRFLIGADGLAHFDPTTHQNSVEYAFNLLADMQFPRTRQWSIVYDVADRAVAFRTARSPEIKTLDLRSIDFSAGTTVRAVADIDAIGSGDISDGFEPLSEDVNRAIIGRFLTSLVGFVSGSGDRAVMDEYLRSQHDLTLQEFIARAHRMSLSALSESQ
ncbi:MAG: linear amide C-N hydrolase [Gemmatimonadetes bacterium]|jgi:choloylglycine hydrolase|nr:linear amide C-N hydrolase [Gemmatimonadota bacterium]MBT5964873.1 linear amide C-N hydrolase [Gemmatimonadota bacterium]